jgi:hypothetical protein
MNSSYFRAYRVSFFNCKTILAYKHFCSEDRFIGLITENKEQCCVIEVQGLIIKGLYDKTKVISNIREARRRARRIDK